MIPKHGTIPDTLCSNIETEGLATEVVDEGFDWVHGGHDGLVKRQPETFTTTAVPLFGGAGLSVGLPFEFDALKPFGTWTSIFGNDATWIKSTWFLKSADMMKFLVKQKMSKTAGPKNGAGQSN